MNNHLKIKVMNWDFFSLSFSSLCCNYYFCALDFCWGVWCSLVQFWFSFLFRCFSRANELAFDWESFVRAAHRKKTESQIDQNGTKGIKYYERGGGNGSWNTPEKCANLYGLDGKLTISWKKITRSKMRFILSLRVLLVGVVAGFSKIFIRWATQKPKNNQRNTIDHKSNDTQTNSVCRICFGFVDADFCTHTRRVKCKTTHI